MTKMAFYVGAIGAFLLSVILLFATPILAARCGETICGIPPSEAIAFSWQKKEGEWRACGVVGCISASAEAQALARASADEGSPEYVCDVLAFSKGARRVRLHRLHIPQSRPRVGKEGMYTRVDPRVDLFPKHGNFHDDDDRERCFQDVEYEEGYKKPRDILKEISIEAIPIDK